MHKVIFITGSTDGIGLATAKSLAAQGHTVLLHGRNKNKLEMAEQAVSEVSSNANVEVYLADLSRFSEVETLANEISKRHEHLDVLINNAGILKTPDPITEDGLDARFMVNSIAPFLLTKRLLPLLGSDARVINLSSAAQSPVNLDALAGRISLADDLEIYAQSKLAITMWSRALALSLSNTGPAIIAINPGSLLATRMVKEGFGVAGHDIGIGADILTRLALEEEFSTSSGKYFDNDVGRFTQPHQDGLDSLKSQQIVNTIEAILAGR